MSIDEKVRKTLAVLGVSDAAGVEALFAEVRAAMESEKQQLVARGAPNEAERNRGCKELRDRWLARKNGIVSLIDENWLKKASAQIKPFVGREFNKLRQESHRLGIAALLAVVPLHRSQQITEAGGIASGEGFGNATVTITERADTFAGEGTIEQAVKDLTLPGNRQALGTVHPVTQVMREIEEIFLGLGFTIETGPEIESVYYNFDALNIPESHPARDDWDTLYIDSQTLLRTHTSPVQIHSMEKYGAPLHIICPGKCYRHDNPDSSHATMFHQVEGLAVDNDISFADLKGTLDYFAKKFFGEKIRTNFFPSFFPFTEPSGDVAISCTICDGKGCRVCKESGWLEVMGCGMVHPDVLEHGGIDPAKFSGWAFGLGVERFAMMKYGVNDIQLFTQSDARFLEQF
jgi:phenylalanyl-tRNA synthetase alpha chain